MFSPASSFGDSSGGAEATAEATASLTGFLGGLASTGNCCCQCSNTSGQPNNGNGSQSDNDGRTKGGTEPSNGNGSQPDNGTLPGNGTGNGSQRNNGTSGNNAAEENSAGSNSPANQEARGNGGANEGAQGTQDSQGDDNAGGANSMTPAQGGGALTSLSEDSKERVKQVAEAAKRTYPDKPHMAKLAASQALLESGLHGKKPSRLAKEHNNLFGIKGKGTAGSANMRTGENIGGRNVTINADFAKNATLEDSFAQHKALMSKPRYAKVIAANSFEEAAKQVKLAGYATAPNYSSSLIDVYNGQLSQHF